MSNVIAVHDVENVDTWLREDHRPALFKQFCTGYRLYRLQDQAKVNERPRDLGNLRRRVQTSCAGSCRQPTCVPVIVEEVARVAGS
jgi:hypothetical protein